MERNLINMNMKKIFFTLVVAVVFVSCSKPYVIVQIADAQLGISASEKCEAEGREFDDKVTYELSYLKKAIEMVNEMKPDAVVFTGDQVHHVGNSVEWSAFRTAILAISEDIEVFHLPGNHDIYLAFPNIDMTAFESRYGEGSFVHEDGNVKLVGINTNYIKYDDTAEFSQFEWLENALRKKNRQTTLVFGHHPFFLEDIDEEDGYFQIQKDKRKAYFDMFARRGVSAVYSGHLHNNAEGEYNGIPSITTTSVAYQIGDAEPSVRVITVDGGEVSDELVPVVL